MLGSLGLGPITRLGGPNDDDQGSGSGSSKSPETKARFQLSVLVVDDVEDTRELYQRYFQFQGARVVTADEGRAALRVAESELPDVIVLDLAMPGMTGWEVIRYLKNNPATQEIPVVVLSGQGARESALKAGAASYREKPCLPDDLMAELLRVVGQPRSSGSH